MSLVRRSLAAVAVAALLIGSVAAPAAAAPAPSAVIAVVCNGAVQYSNPYDAPGLFVQFSNAAGGTVGASNWVYCPSGGGRQRIRVTLTGAAATADVSCWNGFIQSGRLSGPMPLKGSCVDTAGSYGAFATFTIR